MRDGMECAMQQCYDAMQHAMQDGERLVLSRRPERPVSTLRNAKDVRRRPRVRVGVRCDRGRAVDVQLSEGVDRDEDAAGVGVDLVGGISARCAVEDARLVEVDKCRVVVRGAIGGRVGRIELAPSSPCATEKSVPRENTRSGCVLSRSHTASPTRIRALPMPTTDMVAVPRTLPAPGWLSLTAPGRISTEIRRWRGAEVLRGVALIE
eukprot:scaffold60584_cov53-Phaeocystis_antarctica.AAC.6